VHSCTSGNGALYLYAGNLGNRVELYGTLVESNTAYGVNLLIGQRGQGFYAVHSVFYNNGSYGIWAQSDRAAYQDTAIHMINSAVVSNSSDGIHMGNGGTGYPKYLHTYNSIYYGNGGYGISVESTPYALGYIVKGNGNAFGSNTSGAYQHIPMLPGEVTLTGDPFTSKSTGDFTLNSTSGAGAACKGVGWPTVIPS